MKYVEGINQALHQLLENDDKVFLIGGGVSSPFYAGRSIKGLLDRFGKERIIDTPVSENAITGVAIGAALTGMKPILMFPRMDFMYYAFDQLINNASLLEQIYDYKINLTIWACINRYGEQGAQHSQAIQGIFTHIPGFKVYMPTIPNNAKNLLLSAVKEDSLILYIDDRKLYETETNYIHNKSSKGSTVYNGYDVTVIATSYMGNQALNARQLTGCEVINVEILKPLDIKPIIKSVKKTGRVIIADASWPYGGFASEISTLINEYCFEDLIIPVKRLNLPDSHAPASTILEKQYYLDRSDIIKGVDELRND